MMVLLKRVISTIIASLLLVTIMIVTVACDDSCPTCRKRPPMSGGRVCTECYTSKVLPWSEGEN